MNEATIENTNPAKIEPTEYDLELPELEITNEFYVVSKKKFLFLYFSTIGIYSIYWFYKNWQLQKIHLKETYWPAMRGLFYIFFTHDLLKKIDATLRKSGKKYHWDHPSLATPIVVLTIGSNLLSRFSGKYIGSPYTDIGAILLTIVVGVLLFKVQHAINVACNDPDGTSNQRFSALNIVWIVLGAILTILVIIGAFVPAE